MDRIITTLNSLSKGMHSIGALILIPLMTVIITLDVVLRYIFNSPLIWGHDAVGLLLLNVFFMSIVYCWDENRHVRMEIFYDRFGSIMKRIIDTIAAVVGVTFFGAVASQCLLDVPYMIRTNERGDQLSIQLWPFKVIIALVSFFFILKLLVFIFSKYKTQKDV